MNTIYKGIVYLESDNQFEQLMKEGSVTLASGEVVTYSPNDTTYYTPSSAVDKEYVDNNFIKKTDYASQENAGIVKVSSGNYGITLDNNNILYNVKALNAEIDAKTQDYKSITPTNLNYAVTSSLTADNGISLSVEQLSKLKSKFEIPTEYLKDASVTDNTLTITKQDNTQVTFQGGQDISNKVDSKLSKEFTKEDNTKYTNYSQIINTLEPTSSESKGINLIYTNNVNPDSENNIGSSSILQMTDSGDETSLVIVNSKLLNDGNGKISQILTDPTTINMFVTNADSTVGYQTIVFGLSSDGITSELIKDDKTNSISQHKDGIKISFTNNNKTSAFNINENEINVDTSTLTPNIDNSIDLGKTTNKFKNLYLAGKLSDGTNEITVADLVSGGQDISGKVDKAYVDTEAQVYTNVYNGKYNITDSEGNISDRYGTAITYSSDKAYNPIIDEEGSSANNYGGLYCNMYKAKDYTGTIKNYHKVGMIEGSNEDSIQKITGLNLSTIDDPQIQIGLTKLITTSTGDVDTANSIATQVQINNNGMSFADMLGRDNLSITSEGITAKYGVDGTTYNLKYSNIATKNDIPDTSSFITKDVNDLTNYTTTTNLTTLLSNKVDKSSIVQTTGNSTTNVMSQKVVTDELAKKINITGGTFTGEVKFNETDGSCINYDTGFYINKNNGSTLLGTNGANAWVGTPDTALTMRGNATNPTYNGNALALKSDIPPAQEVNLNITSVFLEANDTPKTIYTSSTSLVGRKFKIEFYYDTGAKNARSALKSIEFKVDAAISPSLEMACDCGMYNTSTPECFIIGLALKYTSTTIIVSNRTTKIGKGTLTNPVRDYSYIYIKALYEIK